MPSRYSSDHSKSDAELLAANLGIDYRTIPIEPSFQAYLDMLAPSFEGREPGLTYENIQSRCRGQTLMALSNEFGWMVLTTGNKSEMAVGYFTIYGDSVGGYGVIKDVLKTRVYDLCRYVNRTAGREIVPEGRDHQAAVGRTATRPARRPEPAAVRGARSDPRAVHRGRPHGRRDHRARPRRGRGPPHHPARRHRRVQAAAVPSGSAGEHARRSARTAGCRSPTATAAEWPRRQPPTVLPWLIGLHSPTTTICARSISRNLAAHDRRTIDLDGRRHAAVAILLVDSEAGSDGDDPVEVTADDLSIIPSDVTGLDGRMAGVAGGAVVRPVPSQRRTQFARLAVGAAGRPDRCWRDGDRRGVARDRRGGRRAARSVVRARPARRLRHAIRVRHDAGGRVGWSRCRARAESE